MALIDLDAGAEGVGALERLTAIRAAVEADAELRRAASASGPALALACLSAHRGPLGSAGRQTPAFALSVGDAVVRGLPTAARATLSAEVPLRSGLVEAQFGGAFGAAFARSWDALLVIGGRAVDPVVVAMDAAGRWSARPASAGVRAAGSTGARASAAVEERGTAAHVLTTGPAADAGVPFANLASIDGDGAPHAPSLVGRGGLGAALARQGVVAVLVHVPVASGPAAGPVAGGDADGIRSTLVRSPRLLSRAAGGTLELSAIRGAGSAASPDAKGATKHGCRGCPTPCGWQFDLGARSVTARFSALDGAAGPDGSTSSERALAFVERCNELGMDARAASAAVSARARTQGAPPGVAGLDGLLTDAADLGEFRGQEPALAAADLAGRVGTAMAARGPEPVRSLSVFGLAGPARLRGLPGLALTGDPERDAGALAYWHECFAAAVDISGFCAFSAAGLVADGVVELDELAGWLLPAQAGGASRSPGALWMGMGALHVGLHRRWAPAAQGPTGSIPEPAIAGYREAERRAFRSHGDGSGEMGGDTAADRGGAAAGPTAGATAVHVVASGAMARRLAAHPGAVATPGGDRIEVRLDRAGSTVLEILEAVAEDCPAARAWLLHATGVLIPGVVRDGRVVDADTVVAAGESIELIVVVPGG